MTRTATVLAVLVLLTGCGTAQRPTLPAGSERVPITPRAIAAVMLNHLPDDTTTREGNYPDESDPAEQLGAELRYNGGPGEDGDLVRATVTPGVPDSSCEPSRCVELATEVEGATLELHWDVGDPEQEPGVVGVLLQRADEYTYLYQGGPLVTGDPRDLDLSVTVDDMVAIAEDPWLRLRTSPEAIKAGEDLDDWDGPEPPDPHAHDRVPNTDFGLVAVSADFGFNGSFADFATSPLKDDLGPGAIGGRMIRKAGSYDPAQGPVVIDVLAAPDPDAWRGADPCAGWAGKCEVIAPHNGQKGPLYLLWRPAEGGDPGVVWAATRRRDQVIAIQIVGPRVPQTQKAVGDCIEWPLLGRLLGQSSLIGVETDKEVLDRAEDFTQ